MYANVTNPIDRINLIFARERIIIGAKSLSRREGMGFSPH